MAKPRTSSVQRDLDEWTGRGRGGKLRSLKRHKLWRPVGKVVLLVGVLAIDVASLLVGLHDSYVASSYGMRLFAGGLVVAGALGAAGAACLLLSRSSRVKRRTVWTLLVSAVPGALLFVRQWQSYELQPQILLWLGAAILPLTVLLMFWRGGISPSWPNTVSAAVVLTTIAASLPLLVATRPVTQPETLSANVELEVVGRRGSGSSAVNLVKVTSTLTNESRRTLVVVGSVYSVTATMSQPRVPQQPEPVWAELNEASWTGKFESQRGWELVETGFDPLPSKSYFEPGQSDTTSFMVLVPVDRFNTVGIETWTITGRKDRLAIPDYESPLGGTLSPRDGSGRIVAEWPIETGTWSDRLTQRDRYLHLDYSYAGRRDLRYFRPYQDGMQYSVYVDAEAERMQPLQPYNDRLGKTYGINQVGTYAEVAVDVSTTGTK